MVKLLSIKRSAAAMLLWMLLSFSLPAWASTANDPLDSVGIEDAIRLALQENPDIKIAYSRLKQAEAIILQAKSAYYPHFGFYTEYIQADAPSVYLFKTIDQRNFQPGTDFNNPGFMENYESGLSSTMNIYQGGKDRLRTKIADSGKRRSQHNIATAKNVIRAAVVEQFFTVLAAQEQIDVNKKSIKTIEKQLTDVQVKHKGGSVLLSDVLSLKSRLSMAKSTLIQSKNAYKSSLASFENIIGAKVTSLAKPGSSYSVASLPLDYEYAMDQACKMRPELQEAEDRLIAAGHAVEKEKASYLPRVDAMAKVYYDDSSFDYENDRRNWQAGIVLNWDFFSGFNTNASVAKSLAHLEEAEAYKEKIRLQVEMDVLNSMNNYIEAIQRRQVAELGVEQASEALRLVSIEYKGGSANVVRFLNAELAQQAAEIHFLTAQYDVYKTAAHYCRAISCVTTENSANEKMTSN